MTQYRTERDTMGEMQVPADALYGASTQRAVENFPISPLRLPRSFLRAVGLIKASAAKINGQLGNLTPEQASRIEKAALAVAEGEHDQQFVVDVYQTGSGTSTNMNANEVIAHLAGGGVHQNDHVNQGQSSNDVFPTAMHVSIAVLATQQLLPALAALQVGLEAKAREFDGVIKIGRTHLQDAVPMRLGQEFSGYARQIELAIHRIEQSLEGIYELPLGGTAIGTRLNSSKEFAAGVIHELASRTQLPFREAVNHFEAQASKDAVVFFSGSLRTLAVALTKIANDIRWLGSGPRCGLGELKLPETQPGSSIMPGKVNPVIAESLLMVCAQVIGYDATIAWCGAAGNFELNVMMPVMAYDALDAIQTLAAGVQNFQDRCIAGLQADRERAAAYVEQSLAMCTALVPEIGYEAAAAIAKTAYKTGKTVREIASEDKRLSAETLNRALDPWRQTEGEGVGGGG